MNKTSDTLKVRTRPRETPRATKMLQKASKGPLKEGGPQDARTRNEKCDFLVVKSMLNWNPGADTKDFPDLQINKGLYGP